MHCTSKHYKQRQKHIDDLQVFIKEKKKNDCGDEFICDNCDCVFLQGFHFIVSICILCQIIVFCQSKLSYKVVVQYI